MWKISVLAIALVAVAAAAPKWHELDGYSFEEYLVDFQKSYGTIEHKMREKLFQSRIRGIMSHNKDATKSWKKGVNQFTDWTNQELKSLLGYKSNYRLHDENHPNVLHLPHSRALPKNVDWRNKNVITPVKDQGGCGSCWTFGTAETIESFWALAGNQLPVLSEQQIVDCTPNPDDCGGTGGCEGGTAELAMARIITMGGITSESSYPYEGADGQCQFSGNTTNPVAKLSGYKVLISNNYTSVLTAVALIGPMIINVDASSWFDYESGVFDGCDQSNPDIDHCVQLVGYGTDTDDGDFWIVRNSWNAGWGEDGYIRLKRSSNVQCGTDTNPQDGTGCNGGPSQVTVCGTCGILYDVSYPVVA